MTSKEEESNQITLNVNFTSEREEIKKQGLLSNFLGEELSKYQNLEEEEKKEEKNSSDDEDDISPIKTSTNNFFSNDEEDDEERRYNLQLKENKLKNQIQTIGQKLKYIEEKDSDIQNSSKFNKEILEMQKKLELLEKESKEIAKMKQYFAEKQNKINDQVKEALSPVSKINEFERKIKSGKRKIYINKIWLRILDLKLKLSAQKINDSSKISDEHVMDKLDCDSYLFTSMVLEYLILFLVFVIFYGLIAAPLLLLVTIMTLIFHPILVIFRCSSCDSFKNTLATAWKYIKQIFFVYGQLTLIFFFFGILFFPGVLVLLTQIICIHLLGNQSFSGGIDSNWLLCLKILMVIFFFFMSMKEVSSALDAITYFYKKSIEESLGVLFPIRILPQLFQIGMCFWFCYINIYLIAQVDDTASLIQNFAALAIVLEFDNFVMEFLRYMKFYTLYKKFIEIFGDVLNHKSEKKMIKENKKNKLEEYKNNLKEYENILNDLRKNKQNAAEFNPVTDVKDAKNKIERLKKKNANLGASNPNENNVKNENVSDFLKIMNEIFTENVSKKVITRLGKQSSLKTLLKKDEFPIDEKYNLDRKEKLIFNIFGFLVVFSGILTITLIFYEV